MADEGKEKNLVKLLKPHARKATVGAWIPDQVDAKRGGAGSATDNHVLKMELYDGDDEERFITPKQELLKRIGTARRTASFLEEDESLDDSWWSTPYRGDVPKPGQHLPNRAMALTTMMKDLLLMGDPVVDRLVPGRIRFAQYMDLEMRTTAEAASMYFFMLSHFVADACMPCHCDGRKLAAYDEGLHKQLEGHWSKKVGTGFEKKKLLPPDLELTESEARADANRVLQQARDVDDKFGLEFRKPVPGLRPKQDVWLELINVCRASFAVASIIAPPELYPYVDPDARAPFDTVLGQGKEQLRDEVDKIVMHDAVLNTAIVWKHLWKKVSKLDA